MIELKFQPPRDLPSDIEATGKRIEFTYSIKEFSINSEQEKTNKVDVLVSYKLLRLWDFSTSNDLYKIIYLYVRKLIEEKVSQGTLRETENLELNTDNVSRNDKLNPARIPDFIDKIIRI